MTHPPVPRFPNRAHGPVGVLDAESVDGRLVDSAGFVIAALPIPLMAIDRAGGPDHGGARLAGRIDAAGVDLNTGQVIITEAITELPPGEYACGMDLSNVTFELRTADGTPLEDIGLIELDAEEDRLVHVCTAGRLIAVTAYEGSQPRPAFPGALLTVEAP